MKIEERASCLKVAKFSVLIMKKELVIDQESINVKYLWRIAHVARKFPESGF